MWGFKFTVRPVFSENALHLMRQDPNFLRNFITVLRENQTIVWNRQLDCLLTEWINSITLQKKIHVADISEKYFDSEELKRYKEYAKVKNAGFLLN